MLYALDTAWKMTGNVAIIKDFLRALQFLQNPEDAACLPDGSEPPDVVVEQENDCQRVLIDGFPVTDWICPKEPSTGEQLQGSGLSYEELECFYMACLNIAPLLKVEGGKIYAKDECCGWVLVAGQDAPFVTTDVAAQVAAGMSYQQWIDSNKPALPALESAEHEDEGYTTEASLQCAKASALVATMRQFMEEIKDTVTSLVDDNLGFSDVVELLAAGFIIGNIPGVFAVASLIFGARETSETIIEQIDDNLANDEMWSDVICETTERMNNSQVIGTDDVDEVITNWQERDLSGELLKQIIYAYPVSTWQKVTTKALPNTDCGCEQYLPFGYVPPIPTGKIHFLQMASAGGAGINSWQLVSGEPLFNQINLTPIGSRSGGNFTSVYVGSGAFYYQGIGILLTVPTDVIITDMDYTLALSGAFDEVKLNFVSFRPGTGWVNGGAVAPNAAGSFTATGHFEGTTGITHLLIQLKGSGSVGVAQPVTLSAIKFTGTIAGVAFVDKAIDESLT